MTEAEKLWVRAVNKVAKERVAQDYKVGRSVCHIDEAACRLIEEFEAFRQEVSDAVERLLNLTNINKRYAACLSLNRFIIAKPEPDPLEAAMRKALPASMPDHHVKAICKNLRRELPGLKIVEVDDD